jgi:hypothetical protein
LQPKLLKSNPARGVEGRIAISGRQPTDVETVNVLDLMERVFREKNRPVLRQEFWLELPESGFVILPQIAGVDAMPQGGVHSVTTIQVHHPTLTPDGVFEYQHSWGDTVTEAMARGFDQWFQVDFVAFEDALLPQPKTCMTMEMSFPATEGKPEYCRRAVLGPVAHFKANQASQVEGEEHPFCPCCFFTSTFMAYKELIESPGFFALRFFAARGADGEPEADCRVNGDDWPAGMAALREYVTKWPGTGYEFRKQSVLLQTIDRLTHTGDQTT